MVNKSFRSFYIIILAKILIQEGSPSLTFKNGNAEQTFLTSFRRVVLTPV